MRSMLWGLALAQTGAFGIQDPLLRIRMGGDRTAPEKRETPRQKLKAHLQQIRFRRLSRMGDVRKQDNSFRKGE